MLPLICSMTAVIWEFGLLRLMGKGLDPFAILVPFLILAVSVSHGVQYVNAWVGEITMNRRNSFDASLETWRRLAIRSEEHTSELQSLMRISYAVFCLKKKK